MSPIRGSCRVDLLGIMGNYRRRCIIIGLCRMLGSLYIRPILVRPGTKQTHAMWCSEHNVAEPEERRGSDDTDSEVHSGGSSTAVRWPPLIPAVSPVRRRRHRRFGRLHRSSGASTVSARSCRRAVRCRWICCPRPWARSRHRRTEGGSGCQRRQYQWRWNVRYWETINDYVKLDGSRRAVENLLLTFVGICRHFQHYGL